MYTQIEIDTALEVWKSTGSQKKTRLILGYPSVRLLKNWVREYRLHGKVEPKNQSGINRRFTNEQKQAAIERALLNGCNISRTVRELGYPSRLCLKNWLDAYSKEHPKCKEIVKHAYIPPSDCTKQQKQEAVLQLYRKKRTAIAIARDYGVSRATLYAWAKEFSTTLGNQYSSIMSKQQKPKAISEKRKTLGSNARLASALRKVDQLEKQVALLTDEAEELQKHISRLKMQKDVLVQAAEILKKAEGVNLENLSNREKAHVIDALRKTYKLKDLLLVLKMAKSSYCYQRRAMSFPEKYVKVRAQMKDIFENNYQSYGYRRLWCSLRSKGLGISEKVVRRLMKEEGLSVRRPRLRKYSSYLGEFAPTVPNLIARNFHSHRPNEKWLTDITEFSIPAGKVYLSPIIDCFDGMPVAWSISTTPTAELANSMLKAAVRTLKPQEHPIIHSDRGFHYQWPEWIQLTETHKLTRSMSKKGCSADNSACEGFFGRMKNEMFYGRAWHDKSLSDFVSAIDQYMHWYKESRIKTSLGGLSPIEFRARLGLL